jgi:hypothetical protein
MKKEIKRKYAKTVNYVSSLFCLTIIETRVYLQDTHHCRLTYVRTSISKTFLKWGLYVLKNRDESQVTQRPEG